MFFLKLKIKLSITIILTNLFEVNNQTNVFVILYLRVNSKDFDNDTDQNVYLYCLSYILSALVKKTFDLTICSVCLAL